MIEIMNSEKKNKNKKKTKLKTANENSLERIIQSHVYVVVFPPYTVMIIIIIMIIMAQTVSQSLF
mgnify:CR=1 FL=1